MKGPMKGAAIGHAKQRICGAQYLGITEPGIIAAESPNPIVNNLVILPDIEKRLEAFIRLGNAIVIFPGGVGTAEEILYLLGILLDPHNSDIPFPLILTGPREAEGYFKQVNRFIGETLGIEAQQRYRVIIDDPQRVAREVQEGVNHVRKFRMARDDAFYYNWLLHIDKAYQCPFKPTHENMRSLPLNSNQPRHVLAANLRRVFSGIVAGNVKDEGIRAIEEKGPFEIHGDPAIMAQIDLLLSAFVDQQRMRLNGRQYVPCYRISM
jgi:predicted Rossmann-fold nucleotide-binding protein